MALPERLGGALQNADALKGGGGRVLGLALLGVGIVWFATKRAVRPRVLGLGLAAVVVTDLWTVERQMFVFQGPASAIYRADPITAAVTASPLPYRVLDAGVYQGSWLMALGIPGLLGYHGNELHAFDELMGGKNEWASVGAPALFDLFAIRYLIVGSAVELPGWSLVNGPTATTGGRVGFLYQRDTVPDWARVVGAAAKVPEEQLIPTLLDPRFPVDRVVLLADTTTLAVAPIEDMELLPGPGHATVTDWRPGRMTIALEADRAGPGYLVVSENWYPDWKAEVDGVSVSTLRGQYSLITVPVPASAREVVLTFRSEAYQRGKLISLIALALALGLLVGPGILQRRARG